MNDGFVHILPIFLIALLGWILKKQFLTNEEFWKGLEKLSYFIFTPCIIFNNTATHGLGSGIVIKLIICLILSCSILGFGLIYFNHRTHGDPLKFTSVFQGSFRFNGLIFLALAQALYGANGLEAAAIIAVYMIIFTNFAIILIYNLYLVKYDANGTINILQISKNIFLTPVIIASIAGFIFDFLDLKLHIVAKLSLVNISNAALTMGILIAGARIKFALSSENIKYVYICTIGKMVIFPIITIIICQIFLIPNYLKTIAVLYSCMPAGSSSYIVAKFYGGDAESMLSIITTTTIFSLLSLMCFTYIIS
jgi:malonate transporter